MSRSAPLGTSYPRRIGPQAIATGAAAVVYEAPERNAVRQITLANTTAGDLTATVYIVPVGGSPAVGNQIAPTITIPANDVSVVPIGFILGAGESVYAIATGAVNIMFNAYDREPGDL